jgi:hypothetical protein
VFPTCLAGSADPSVYTMLSTTLEKGGYKERRLNFNYRWLDRRRPVRVTLGLLERFWRRSWAGFIPRLAARIVDAPKGAPCSPACETRVPLKAPPPLHPGGWK